MRQPLYLSVILEPEEGSHQRVRPRHLLVHQSGTSRAKQGNTRQRHAEDAYSSGLAAVVWEPFV